MQASPAPTQELEAYIDGHCSATDHALVEVTVDSLESVNQLFDNSFEQDPLIGRQGANDLLCAGMARGRYRIVDQPAFVSKFVGPVASPYGADRSPYPSGNLKGAY